ncbi:MAG TPA: FUSC family protein, partial [Chitinophagaceae bacterium]|nr:FUSC family protein [Chitinophagaceae bacterium]
QDAVREFFFKTARIVTETTPTGRKLVATFVHSVDLFEDITATYYNYSMLRRRFAESGILQAIANVILELAANLDNIGIAILSNQKQANHFNADEAIRKLKSEIDALQKKEPEENTLLLKKILVNVRRMAQRITDINLYFDKTRDVPKSHVDHTLFIGHQDIDLKLLLNNFNFKSNAFKHALRISVACVIGFSISKLLAYGQHSYWIVLTIAFILKPNFSLTKTRNIERIWGTVTGGVIGVLLLYFVQNTTAQFVFMVLLMLGTFTFLRTRYVVMVICTTAYILILFHFLNIPFISVAQERIFDTVLGCVIAFSAGYFLFPDWEAEQIKKHMADMLLANAAYLQKIIDQLNGLPFDTIGYKLARKLVYVQSANLSAAYQRMAAEPKNRQHDAVLIHQFLVRNHLLYSNIAHIAALLNEQPPAKSISVAQVAQTAKENLNGLSKKLYSDIIIGEATDSTSHKKDVSEEVLLTDLQVKTSVDFIAKLCEDIGKTTDAILAA